MVANGILVAIDLMPRAATLADHTLQIDFSMLETLDIILLTKNSSECHSELWLKFDYSTESS